ncbi:MAG: hypothetical protein ACK55Z_03940, partial [bacterium]
MGFAPASRRCLTGSFSKRSFSFLACSRASSPKPFTADHSCLSCASTPCDPTSSTRRRRSASNLR